MQEYKPVISIVGLSKTGKTTFLEALIKELTSRGLKVGAVKHTHRDFEIDIERKDSYRLKNSGAKTVVLSSSKRIALIEDFEEEIPLDEIIKRFMKDVDIVITEGYKKEKTKKIEVFDKKCSREPLFRGDKNLFLLICDESVDIDVPVFRKDEAQKVADFVIQNLIQKNIVS